MWFIPKRFTDSTYLVGPGPRIITAFGWNQSYSPWHEAAVEKCQHPPTLEHQWCTGLETILHYRLSNPLLISCMSFLFFMVKWLFLHWLFFPVQFNQDESLVQSCQFLNYFCMCDAIRQLISPVLFFSVPHSCIIHAVYSTAYLWSRYQIIYRYDCYHASFLSAFASHKNSIGSHIFYPNATFYPNTTLSGHFVRYLSAIWCDPVHQLYHKFCLCIDNNAVLERY